MADLAMCETGLGSAIDRDPSGKRRSSSDPEQPGTEVCTDGDH
jgi:hypothetical protein